MAGVVVDTPIWIEFFAGRPTGLLEDALLHGAVIIPPIVVAELISGASTPAQRASIGELLQNVPIPVITSATLESRL